MKYIIEFEDVPYMREDGVNYYTCKSARWYKLEDTIINRLTPYTEPNRKAVDLQYARDIENVAKMNYNEGAKDAWEFAKKIGSFNGLSKHELDECFGHTTIQGVMTTYDTYQEAKEKYEGWRKQKDEIRVGDELKDDGNIRAVVLDILDVDYECYEVFTENGIVDEWQKGIVLKTGRHFDDIADLLKKMKEQ